jgi:hypothetical protein
VRGVGEVTPQVEEPYAASMRVVSPKGIKVADIRTWDRVILDIHHCDRFSGPLNTGYTPSLLR